MRAAVGLGEGVAPSAATDMVARVIAPEERSRAIAFIFGGLHVGSLLGLLVAPVLIDRFGWQTVRPHEEAPAQLFHWGRACECMCSHTQLLFIAQCDVVGSCRERRRAGCAASIVPTFQQLLCKEIASVVAV